MGGCKKLVLKFATQNFSLVLSYFFSTPIQNSRELDNKILQSNNQQLTKMTLMNQNVDSKIGQMYNQSRVEIEQKLTELHINLSDM
jgi:hypothetical protein